MDSDVQHFWNLLRENVEERGCYAAGIFTSAFLRGFIKGYAQGFFSSRLKLIRYYYLPEEPPEDVISELLEAVTDQERLEKLSEELLDAVVAEFLKRRPKRRRRKFLSGSAAAQLATTVLSAELNNRVNAALLENEFPRMRSC